MRLNRSLFASVSGGGSLQAPSCWSSRRVFIGTSVAHAPTIDKSKWTFAVEDSPLSKTHLSGAHSSSSPKLSEKKDPGAPASKNVSPPPPPPPPQAAVHSFAKMQASTSTASSRGYRTPPEVLEMLIPFIPTFWISSEVVFDVLPDDAREMVRTGAINFPAFLKKYRFYFEQRTSHNRTEIRLRPDLAHPKRGAADVRHSAGMSSSDIHRTINSAATPPTVPQPSTSKDAVVFGVDRGARGRAPPRNSEANLVLTIVGCMKNGWIPLPQVLQHITPIVVKHPSYDGRLGVTGFLEKHPQYFQIVEGKIRVRPFACAPFAIDELDEKSSPMPEALRKVLAALPPAAETLDAALSQSKDTAVLQTLLSETEMSAVRDKFKNFSRFLRAHGKLVMVSTDNMRVRRFVPDLEACADHLVDPSLQTDALRPDDPVLKIPSKIEDTTNADFAVRELYDALPLMQAVPLADLLVLVPSGVRQSLPQTTAEVYALLQRFPDYFSAWPYPDDTTQLIVQRAKLPTADLTPEELMRTILPLIPQGGIDADKLMRKLPLPVQRYLYKHGLQCVVKSQLETYVVVLHGKVLRVG